MSDEHVHLQLRTCKGEPFTIKYANDLAEFFFRTNLSYRYDEWAKADAHPNRITPGDISAINQTMAAHSAAKRWTTLTDGDVNLSCLLRLDRDWDLFDMPDAAWQEHDLETRLGDAFEVTMGPYRGAAVATKVLHIKRPALIPVCDSVVANVMGTTLLDSGDWKRVREFVVHLRSQGRANLDGLKAMQERLGRAGFDRTTVRIFDSVLWTYGHQDGPYAVFGEWLTRVYG